MEMTKYAQAIKAELANELKKQGSSLLALEEALKNINTGEGVLKTALLGTDLLRRYSTRGIDSAVDNLTDFPDLALKGSLAGGAMAGFTLDEMDRSVQGIDKALEREREKVNLVRRITANLRKEHGIN
jgi:hypothetical protein